MIRHTCVLTLASMLLGTIVLAQRHSATGPLVRAVPVGVDPPAMAVDAAIARAVVLDSIGGRIHLLDTRDGSTVATITLGQNPLSVFPDAVAMDARSGHAYVYTEDGTLYMLDARNGAVLRSVPVGPVLTSQSAAGLTVDPALERVFAFNRLAGEVSILDARSGALLRTIQTPFLPVLTIDVKQNQLDIVGARSAAPPQVLDARGGRTLQGARGAPCAIITASSRAIPTSGVDPATGAWYWLDRRGGIRCMVLYGRTVGSVAVDARTGHLFTLDPSGNLVRMLDARKGATLAVTHVTANTTALSMDAVHEHLLVVSIGPTDALGRPHTDGILSVIDARSGRLLRTLRVGACPTAIAVDERSDRAFVLNTHSNPDGSRARIMEEENTLLSGLRAVMAWLPWDAAAMPAATGSVTVLNTAQL